MEVHFHIFHPENSNEPIPDGIKPTGALLFFLILMYPLLSILGMGLIISLIMYCTDHAPFQSIHVLRPDHFMRLQTMVYRAWFNSAGGKLKPKDL